MSNLPPAIQEFAAILGIQSRPVQMAFQYALCRLMVEYGKMRLVETIPGENGATCIFETTAGDLFNVTRPPMDKETEAALVVQLRKIFDDEGE
jgi:hypothetical protein